MGNGAAVPLMTPTSRHPRMLWRLQDSFADGDLLCFLLLFTVVDIIVFYCTIGNDHVEKPDKADLETLINKIQ